nr:MAG TPA: hypothetical protein [Caudoviricetes sp.]
MIVLLIDLEKTKDIKIKMNGKIYDIIKISSRKHKSQCQLLLEAIDISEDVKEKLKIIDEIKNVVNDIEQELLKTNNILNNMEV